MTQSDQQPPPPPEEEDSSLVPALLTVYAMYLAWRGANSTFRGSALQVRRALSLDSLAGNALTGVAVRALADQQGRMGRAGDALWAQSPAAAQMATEIGLDVLSEALLWMDRHTQGDPSTSDANTAVPGEATVPTGEDPPEILARMLATAVTNAATLHAVGLVGWTTKTWQTRQDDRVRDTHRMLQDQSQPLGEPFTVAGHKLQFPGDPAAPIDQRINCRCWMTYAR